LIEKLHKERPNLPKVKTPTPPKENPKARYGVIKVTEYLNFDDLLNKTKPIVSDHPKHMESLDIGPNYGQNFGFTLYRTKVPKIKSLVIKGLLTQLDIDYDCIYKNNFYSKQEVFRTEL
jgi:hypothetical protein